MVIFSLFVDLYNEFQNILHVDRHTCSQVVMNWWSVRHI